MACGPLLPVVNRRTRSLPSSALVLLFLSLLRVSSDASLSSSTKSSLSVDDDQDDVFTFTGRSFVEYLQPALPTVDSAVGHIVRVELEFRTFASSTLLLHRDPRRNVDDGDMKATSEIADDAQRHVTGCTREAEIRVQLKIGMLHVSVIYDATHVSCVTVGQGQSLFRLN